VSVRRRWSEWFVLQMDADAMVPDSGTDGAWETNTTLGTLTLLLPPRGPSASTLGYRDFSTLEFSSGLTLPAQIDMRTEKLVLSDQHLPHSMLNPNFWSQVSSLSNLRELDLSKNSLSTCPDEICR